MNLTTPFLAVLLSICLAYASCTLRLLQKRVDRLSDALEQVEDKASLNGEKIQDLVIVMQTMLP